VSEPLSITEKTAAAHRAKAGFGNRIKESFNRLDAPTGTFDQPFSSLKKRLQSADAGFELRVPTFARTRG
jgi:hypothetical protein